MHRLHTAVGTDSAVQLIPQGVRQDLNPFPEGRQGTARTGRRGHLFALGPFPALLPGQLEHGLEQPAVVTLQLCYTRKTGFKRHGLGVTGEDTGYHRSDQFIQRLLPQAAAGEVCQGLIQTRWCGSGKGLASQAQLAGPGEQSALQERGAIFRQPVQFTFTVDKPLASIIVTAQQMIFDTQGTAQIKGLGFVVQKPVWAPLAGEAIVANSADLATNPGLFFQQGDLERDTAGLSLSAQQPGRGKARDTTADDNRLFH